MKPTQRALRHEAAQAFIESLEQLEYRLNPSPDRVTPGGAIGSSSQVSLHQQPRGLDWLVQEFEDAVADIEQYIQD